MDIYRSLAVISLTALITTFAITGNAQDDFRKDDAMRDKGQTLSSDVEGCLLTVTSPDVVLYSNRSMQRVPIAKVPPGDYQPLDYRPGWYKIRAQGWVAWIQDSANGTKNEVMRKSNCPDKKLDTVK